MKTKVTHTAKGIIGNVQTPEKDTLSSTWETDSKNVTRSVPHMERVKVPGGWLILSDEHVPGGPNQIFVADPNHEWELEEAQEGKDFTTEVQQLLREHHLDDLTKLAEYIGVLENFRDFIDRWCEADIRSGNKGNIKTNPWDLDKEIARASNMMKWVVASGLPLEEWKRAIDSHKEIQILKERFKIASFDALHTRLQNIGQIMDENGIEDYVQLGNVVEVGLKTMKNGVSKAEPETKSKGLSLFRTKPQD